MLSSFRGLSPLRLRELAWRVGNAAACLHEVEAGRAGSAADRAHAARADPEALLEAASEREARLVAPGEDGYPSSLLDLADPPAALFLRGGDPVGSASPCVAVVGARNCTPAGREAAHDLGRALGGAGACVVSGAARGIDAAAHEGALAAGGPTIAVLGCGIDRAYPARSHELLERIAMRGTVASEYGPGVPAEPFRFPARNRIIAALAEAVVVVEGAQGSGSLITADHALDLGRQVFALPWMATSPLAVVPLALLRDGATMIRDGADLLEDLGLAGEVRGSTASGSLPPLEAAVLAHVAGPILPEQVAAAAGLPLPDALAALTRLELRGLIRTLGGRVERRAAERSPAPPA